MHIATFLQDLAIIMMVAGLVTVIFHRLKQPVVLGYILSGVILGRHTPPFSFIYDESTIKTLAELGVIFLMFSLGLEFSLRKLFKVGTAALIAATAEIILMIFVGYQIGYFFGWKSIDSIFLGAMLAISSTTIIIKALNELGMKNEKFAQLIFGILIIEDILAIGILVILPGVAITNSLDLSTLSITLGKLIVFLVASMVISILIVPKLLSYVAKFNSKEMLLITVLALCFGFSLFVIKLGYSMALGAFLIGAIIAEAHELKLIEKLIEPLTNMFSAIFFVSIGLLVDPNIIITYITPILIITVALVIGKVLVCSLGVFVAGSDGRTSMRVGMGLAQIGEFSFIIASLGVSLKVMSPYLYPIIVAVSAITTFLTPYLIKIADPVTDILSKATPTKLTSFFNSYTQWIQNISINKEQKLINKVIKKGLLQVFINLILIIAIFLIGLHFSRNPTLVILINNIAIKNSILWGCSLLISLPFLIAIYRKLKALGMLIAEANFKNKNLSRYIKVKFMMSECLPILSLFIIIMMIIAISVNMLPPVGLLIPIVGLVILVNVKLWPTFIKLHSKFQIAFMEAFKKKKKTKRKELK